jgi:CDP-glycerol glycerophosphotransferase
VLTTSDEVLDALSDLGALAERSSKPLTEFRQVFCALEDGHATERVVDLLTAPRLDEERLAETSA